jgi:hypothetical protein
MNTHSDDFLCFFVANYEMDDAVWSGHEKSVEIFA